MQVIIVGCGKVGRNLAEQLQDCTNREYFQAKKEALIDPVDAEVLALSPEF